MAHVERDYGGNICGVSTNPQHNEDGSVRTVEMPDDHPEVVAFMSRMPKLTQAHMTKEDFEREDREFQQAQDDGPKLERLYLDFVQIWAELETSLSALLYVVLAIEPRSSQIAYAIYYGLNGFDARLNTVSNALIQWLDERKDKELEPLRGYWDAIAKKLEKNARNKRNTIAHSTIQTLIYTDGTGKRVRRALISPLPFDVIRIQREIKETGKSRGMDVNEFTIALKRMAQLRGAVDALSHVIESHRRFGADATLPKTIPKLEACLQALSNPL